MPRQLIGKPYSECDQGMSRAGRPRGREYSSGADVAFSVPCSRRLESTNPSAGAWPFEHLPFEGRRQRIGVSSCWRLNPDRDIALSHACGESLPRPRYSGADYAVEIGDPRIKRNANKPNSSRSFARRMRLSPSGSCSHCTPSLMTALREGTPVRAA